MRQIDGFVVEAVTEPNYPGSSFYEPGLRVTKPGTDFDETVWATTQDRETQTRADALAAAEAWLQRIDGVTYTGTLNILE
ncbi:hypothetical protein [Lysobacter niastensis]|uniref:Uncharacterized protein n=1 Tax=Lysobacter niastensis TaxID=380629 RepID=A0ABS0B311_9GAMM|nr:hypothetical protein [Lysobacter niastensis]MBF6022866.1 hypothetical protein [Lysobacter niastensis]